MINLATGFLIAAAPYLLSGVLSAGDVPPLLAYLLFPGRNLFALLGSLVALWSLLRDRTALASISRGLEAVTAHRAFPVVMFALITVVAFARVPQQEKEAGAFGGDEPKYLRIAFSLLRDTDADVSGGRTQSPDLQMRLQQVRTLVLTGRDAAAKLFHPVVIPEGHVWNAGNWTVRGLEGGLYHLQPPGLPALVAVALGIGEAILPERDPGIYVFVLLALIWVLGARELWLLSVEITGDRTGSAGLVAMVLLSAPVYIGGYQLFPESLALWLFPWLFRRLRTSERELRTGTALLCGLVTGYLLWVHPKLTIVAALFAVMALARPDTQARSRAAFGLTFGVVAFASLLYCFHVSGLFRPEGLYIRQAEEYVGSPNPLSLRFAAGAVKALLGGRDGLFVFAPILVLGLVVLRALKRPSRSTFEAWCLFGVVWLTSAVHDGASLGSPARLMAPVAFVPALFLARALRDRPPAPLAAAAVLLFVFGGQITETMSSDWRKNVNPYRAMFPYPATNFEPSLPGNSFSDESYIVDLQKAGLILLTLVIVTGLIRRAAAGRGARHAPAMFGMGVVSVVAVLAFGLHWLTP